MKRQEAIRDKFWRWVSYRLPRRLVYFAAIRVGCEVHSCVFGDIPLPEMNHLQACRAFKDNLKEESK